MTVDTAIIIALISFVGTLITGFFQLRVWRSQSTKNTAEAGSIEVDAHQKERLNDFQILRDVNKELKAYIEDLRCQNKELEEKNKLLKEKINLLELTVESLEEYKKKNPPPT